MRKTKKNEKGFTLAELLIVVAIIAVLVAISIPIFTTQLEKSREATDAANIRAAYAEVMAAALTEDDKDPNVTRTGDAAGSYIYTYKDGVAAKQTKADWQSTNIEDIGGLKVGNADGDVKAKTKNNSWTISYSESTGAITIQ